jgi:transcriptional regulator with XRE-family HTH domain
VPRVSLTAGFGLAVRQLRERRKLSQESLAHSSGLHRNHLGQLERGEMSPTLATIETLAQALDLSASELIAHAEQLTR